MDTWVAIVGVAAATSLGWLLMWIGGVKEHRGEVTKFMDEIRADIKKILRRLPADPVGVTSPLSLTDFGEEIAEAVGALAWAKEHAEAVGSRALGKAAYTKLRTSASRTLAKSMNSDRQ